MEASKLYSKYLLCIEELANERLSTERSLSTLYALLQQYQREAAMLNSADANFVCDKIADQLEHEAHRCRGAHRRDVLFAAVKCFDAMAFLAETSTRSSAEIVS